MIAISSILEIGPSFYTNKPWEITADMFGGVIRFDHAKIAKQIGVAYLGAAALLDGIIPCLGTTLLTIIYTS